MSKEVLNMMIQVRKAHRDSKETGGNYYITGSYIDQTLCSMLELDYKTVSTDEFRQKIAENDLDNPLVPFGTADK